MDNTLRGLDDYLTTDRRDLEPRQHAPHTEYAFCDECGGDVFAAVSLQGVGLACSAACMAKLVKKHDEFMNQGPRR